MKRETLKKFRVITPALMLLFILLPILPILNSNSFINEIADHASKFVYISIVVVIGILYNTSNFRSYFNSKFHRLVKINIREKLWLAARPSPVPDEWDERKWRDTFYRLIDNDSTLTARSEIIYHNGALWTACADAKVIGIFGFFISICILISGLFTINAACIMLLSILLLCLGYLLANPITKNHIKLSSEQIEYIEFHKKEDLDQYISNYNL